MRKNVKNIFLLLERNLKLPMANFKILVFPIIGLITSWFEKDEFESTVTREDGIVFHLALLIILDGWGVKSETR